MRYEFQVNVSWSHGICLLISGDVNFVDYEISEFRSEVTDIAAMLYHRDMLEIIGEKIAPLRGLLLS